MGLAGFGVESLADEDAADHGVRAGVAGRLPRQLDAPPHVVRVDVPRLRPAPHGGRETPRAAAGDSEAGARRGGCGGGVSRGEAGARWVEVETLVRGGPLGMVRCPCLTMCRELGSEPSMFERCC